MCGLAQFYACLRLGVIKHGADPFLKGVDAPLNGFVERCVELDKVTLRRPPFNILTRACTFVAAKIAHHHIVTSGQRRGEN